VIDIQAMQYAHSAWRQANFPDAEPWEALAGLMEEVGELSHAHLKGKWGIRGMTGEALKKAKADAVGDIFIYLMSYCGTNDLDLDQCIENAWAEVRRRNWQQFPTSGGPS
jgi:NTP pyrophosphatase (non-canonical NTP hydrolase)